MKHFIIVLLIWVAPALLLLAIGLWIILRASVRARLHRNRQIHVDRQSKQPNSNSRKTA